MALQPGYHVIFGADASDITRVPTCAGIQGGHEVVGDGPQTGAEDRVEPGPSSVGR